MSIRTAIADTINNNVADLRAYDTAQDIVAVPAMLVLPADSDFVVAFARGSDTYQFDLFVMVSRTVPRTAQNALDAYVTGAGGRSIREAIWNNKALGLADGTEAHVRGMSRYGGAFPAGGRDPLRA